jgi:hypothetical protein
MKCPTCVKEGLRSTVHVVYNNTMFKNPDPYFDEDGKLVRAPIMVKLQCSNGHNFEEEAYG